MPDRILLTAGGQMQVRDNGSESRLVPFPVCLAIRYGDEVPETCPDFVLNIRESWVLVRTDASLPDGADVLLHFYIPPETKLLAEVRGRVAPRGRPGPHALRGALIRIALFSRWKLRRMERYATREQRLVDRRV